MKKNILPIASALVLAIGLLFLFGHYLSTRGHRTSYGDKGVQAPGIRMETPEIEGQLTYPVEITDAKGHSLTLHRPPKRIVVLSSEAASCIIFLGKAEYVIGRLAHQRQPELAHAKIVSGGSLPANYEALAAMKPDLVLLNLMNYEDKLRICEKYKLPHFAFKIRKIDEMPQMYRLFAKLFHAAPSKVEELEHLLETLHRVAERMEGLKLEERPKVFFEFQYRPALRTVGAHSITADIIWKAGGQISPRCGGFAAAVSVESLMEHPPDWYLIGEGGFIRGKTSLEEVRKRPMLGKLRCVTENRVLLVPILSYMQSHPKTIDNVIELARKLHPERMKDFE